MDRPDPVVAKRLLVCDAIEKRSDGGVNLINLWLLRKLPRGWNGEAAIRPFSAFAWITNGRGRVRFRLYISAELPNGDFNSIWSSDPIEVAFADLTETRFLCMAVSGLKISAPGDYLVELHCEDESGSTYYLEDVVVSFVV